MLQIMMYWFHLLLKVITAPKLRRQLDYEIWTLYTIVNQELDHFQQLGNHVMEKMGEVTTTPGAPFTIMV